MALTFAAYATPGAVSTPRLVDSQAQSAPSPSRLSCGQGVVKFPGAHDVKSLLSLVCASASNSEASGSLSNGPAIAKEPTSRGRPKTTNSSTTTKAGKKKAEGKQVVDGSASDEDESHIKADQSQNGKPKPAVHLFEYEEGPWPCFVSILPHLHDVAEALADHIARISAETIKHRGCFTIVLSGGSLVNALSRLVEEPYSKKIDWAKWYVFWADERMVPISHADSNYNHAKSEFLSKVPIPQENLITIDDWDVSSAAANSYENRLKDLTKGQRKVLHTTTLDHLKYPRFDLVLLGIGPDGHIASLFPNTLQLAERRRWVVSVTKSPKPPARRISLTLPCINAAAHVAFVVIGSSKAEVLQRVFERAALPGALPAQLVRPKHGELTWFVDKAAAARLSIDHYSDPKKFPYFDWSSLQETKVNSNSQA